MGVSDRMIDNKVNFKVRFSEIDSLGIAYNAAYYTWFELGRFHFSEKIMRLELEQVLTKYRFPVIRSACKYLRQIKFNEDMYVETYFYFNHETSRIEFFYKLYNVENELCAMGVTTHLLVDPQGKMHINMDEYLLTHMDEAKKTYDAYFLLEKDRNKWMNKINR